jgi:hypothetical protein
MTIDGQWSHPSQSTQWPTYPPPPDQYGGALPSPSPESPSAEPPEPAKPKRSNVKGWIGSIVAAVTLVTLVAVIAVVAQNTNKKTHATTPPPPTASATGLSPLAWLDSHRADWTKMGSDAIHAGDLIQAPDPNVDTVRRAIITVQADAAAVKADTDNLVEGQVKTLILDATTHYQSGCQEALTAIQNNDDSTGNKAADDFETAAKDVNKLDSAPGWDA